MLVSENAKPPTPNLKCASPPTETLKFALPLTQTPDASQWNIGGVGSPTQNFRVGHVHFMLFMSISFASGTQRKPIFPWNMGLTPDPHPLSTSRYYIEEPLGGICKTL